MKNRADQEAEPAGPGSLRKRTANRHWLTGLAVFGLGALVGLLIGVPIGFYSHSYGRGLTVFLGIAAILPAIWIYEFVDDFVHEGGHILGGLLVGFGFKSVQVSGLKLSRTDKGFKLSAEPIGMAAPRSEMFIHGTHLQLKMAVYVLAGPLVTLALAVASFWVYRTNPWHVSHSTPPLTRFLLVWTPLFFAWGNAFDLLANLSLKTYRGASTDLTRLLAQRDKYAARSQAAMAKVIELMKAGVRPRERDPELMAEMKACLSRPGMGFLLYYYYLDSRQWEEAAKCLKHDYDVWAPKRPVTTRRAPQAILHEYAFIQALLGQADSARAALWQGNKWGDQSPMIRRRAEIAVLAVEGKWTEARAQADEFAELAKASKESQEVAWEWVQWVFEKEPGFDKLPTLPNLGHHLGADGKRDDLRN